MLLNLPVGAAQFLERVCYFYLYLSNMQLESGIFNRNLWLTDEALLRAQLHAYPKQISSVFNVFPFAVNIKIESRVIN